MYIFVVVVIQRYIGTHFVVDTMSLGGSFLSSVNENEIVK
jgi:hypothetical protein